MSPLADLTNMSTVRRLPAEKGPSDELGLFCVFGVGYLILMCYLSF